MRKIFLAITLIFGIESGLEAQTYVVDALFTPDSTECRLYASKGDKSKNSKQANAKEKVYLHNGETVQVLSASQDSMGFVKFMSNRDVHIKLDGVEYTTRARNLVLSQDNPGGTIDSVYQTLDMHPGLWDIDMHGKHRYLFNVRLLVIILLIGLAGALLSKWFGRIGLVLFSVPILFFCWYVANLGTQSYWFMDDMAWGDRFYYYLFFALIEAYTVLGVKAIFNEILEDFVIGLIFAILFLPILYIAVWGAIVTQWLALLIIAGVYLWITGVGEGGSGGFLGEIGSGLFDAMESQQKSWDEAAKRRERNRRQGIQ